MGVIYHAHARFLSKTGQKITVPAPWDPETPNVPCWYDYLALKAPELRRAGFSALLLPPSTKSLSGHANTGDGYGVYDHYDIGSKNQMYAYETRFGDRERQQRAIACLHACGIDVYGDVVIHQIMGGMGGKYRFFGSDGKTLNGRWPKDPGGLRGGWPGREVPPFSWPDDVPVPKDDFAFGDELCYQKWTPPTPPHYNYEQVVAWCNWLFNSLGLQGARFDDVKGTWQGIVYQLMTTGAMTDKFFVSEYFDGNPAALDYWVRSQNGDRSAVFDFSMHFKLQAICDHNASFKTLNGAGYSSWNAPRAVGFMDNPDTDLSFGQNIVSNKLIGYACLLALEGYPCVYHKDYAMEPGCYGLKPWLDDLIWIHENLAFGSTVTQHLEDDVIVFNRTGGPGLLTAVNKNPFNDAWVTCPTTFGGHVELQDYTGRHPNIRTDADGKASFKVPKNAYQSGQSSLSFSRTGYSQPFTLQPRPTTNHFYAAADLDIPPVKAKSDTPLGRIWCKKGTPVTFSLQSAAPDAKEGGFKFQLIDTNDTVVTDHHNIPADGWYTVFATSTLSVDSSLQVAVTYSATPGISKTDAIYAEPKIAAIRAIPREVVKALEEGGAEAHQVRMAKKGMVA